MASSGPPGVNSPHPSLPARPPPSSISAAPTTSTTPTTSYGPSAPPTTYGAPPSTGGAGGAAGPKLGYSRTYAPVSTDAGRGYNANNNYNNNNSYSQPQRQPQGPPSYAAGYGPSAPSTTSYGPQYGAAAAQYGPQVPTTGSAGIGPQAYGPTAPPQIQNPFPAHGPQQPQQQYYGAGASGGAGRGGYRQNNNYGNNNNNNNWQGGYNNASAAGAATTYGPSYGPSYGPTAPAVMPVAYGPDGMPVSGDAAAAAAAGQDASGEADDSQTKEKKTATVYRSGGGKTWTDDSLLEWDPSHLRLFVGNLAGEVTDETLLKAFSRWRSVQKALVKRDKWTKKSRGYGFVSFSDADDFFQAAKEMNGKYIGSHPVTVRKSTTDIKVASFKDESGADRRNHHGKNRNNKNKNKNNNNNAGGTGDLSASATNSGTSTPLGGAGGASGKNSGSGGFGKKSSGYEPALGPVSSGVHKPKKTKNGLKLLG